MNVEKQVFVTKFGWKARNPKISIPIDAARPGDVENIGFRQKINEIPKKIDVFLLGGLTKTGRPGQPGKGANRGRLGQLGTVVNR